MAPYTYMDVDACAEALVPRHKTIADIMPLAQAVVARKASKLHKMKPRSVKRDRTKTRESRELSKQRTEARSNALTM